MGTTLGYINDVFRGADLRLASGPEVSGQRRQLVEDYYAGVAWGDPNEVARVLKVYEEVLSTSADSYRGPLVKRLRRDGFEVTEDGDIVPRYSSTIQALSAVLRSGAGALAPYEARIRSNIEADPALAIGSAKELVEAICNLLLEEAGIAADKEWTVAQRFKRAAATLDLTVDNVGPTKKGADQIKHVLAGLVVGGVAELRNMYGTGHGRHHRSTGLQPRHARLAAGAAVTLSRFLLDTRDERKSAPSSQP